MPRSSRPFRVGRVTGYLRGRIWYLQYHDNSQRRRPRVEPEHIAAKRLEAQTNAQLETGDVAMLTFEPVAVPELRQRWLDDHDHVLRSSLHTMIALFRFPSPGRHSQQVLLIVPALDQKQLVDKRMRRNQKTLVA